MKRTNRVEPTAFLDRGTVTEPDKHIEPIVVFNPHGPDLEFRGTLLHHGVYADLGSVWVYRSEQGRYVLRLTRSALRGRTHFSDTRIFETLDDLADYLEWSEGAKRTMEALGKPKRTTID